MRIFGQKSRSGFSGWTAAEEVTQGIDGSDFTAIITGASSGIGAETCRVLALRRVHVIMAVRNTDAGRAVKEAILKDIPTAKIDVMELELTSMDSVRKFASEYISLDLPLNILINNAGVFSLTSIPSRHNIELHFATNHLGMLTMKNTVRKSHKEGRIINVASLAHRYPKTIRFDEINITSSYINLMAYPRSKLANVLHANELARRLKEEGVNITANSLHPGIIYTNIFRNDGFFRVLFRMASKFLLKNVQQGAATTCYLALHPQVEGVSGEYFADCGIAKLASQAKDPELAKKLWDYSLSLTTKI
ncbi:short-chain dehydrogenase TIC 32, chloroplastic-like isoform X3 [Hevea brasiliensis]|uniref:short-chain dehydrogenase TIC 32, chloroplastic-like isoform X3 n=1 Tax=Hevea brasiliensis TaxID=3981 RepID=UPI0025D472FA|nr:short-chain dehydrogenase TIC 32, chloroplastic-like isoform X3 [Hevea brasiliensis]